MRPVYSWKSRADVPNVPAQVAGEELERIRIGHNGRLAPEAVVDASRNPWAPLHPAFEWDDHRAAEAWRVEQARYVIRSIEVVVVERQRAPPTRAFVSVVRDEDRSYTSIVHALSDAELRRQVLQEAWASLEAWRKRYAELTELADVFAAIDQARGAK